MSAEVAREQGGGGGPSDAAQRIPLYRFWQPRHWGTWLLLAWMRIAALLPWRVSIRLHKRFGRAARRLLRGPERIARRNIETCFPEMSPEAVEDLLRRNFESIGAFFAETAMAWFADPRRIDGLFDVEGSRHVAAALAKGRGVILFSGHFTTLEICARRAKNVAPLFAFMYQTRSSDLLNEMQARNRRNAAQISFAKDNVRAMVRSLRRNAAVWYAPDQVYLGKQARLVPFFGVPAMTNIATAKLARLSGAAIVPFFFCRRDDDSGYLLRFEPALEGFPSDDAEADTRRLVEVLERFVRECPDQYMWIHRRFKGRPAPLPNIYSRR
jgi:KDO2-lipid IV(A) lauroyltransferase